MISKLKWLVSIGLIVMICGACGQTRGTLEDEPTPQETPEASSTPKTPDLPGGVLVMIDNHSNARPQSGLDQADVVYEILAEGGITRYMALFYSNQADMVGPVRSARYYFAQLAHGMDLPFAHAGGNQDALTLIRRIGVKDLDEIYNAERYFWRDKSRKAPHNLYTSTDKLTEGAAAKQFAPKIPNLTPIGDRFTGNPLADGTLELDYAPGSRYRYVVSWIWEEGLGPTGGQYRRYINGELHQTLNGNALTADTIFVLEAKTREVMKEEIESEIDLIGEGAALCLVENQIIQGKWVKESAEKPLRIVDGHGNEMKRKEGKTWIQVVAAMKNVHYVLAEPETDEMGTDVNNGWAAGR